MDEQRKASQERGERASRPDDLVKDLEIRVSEEEASKVTGGAADIFAKIGDIKGESTRLK